jgi:hypothetical protein
MYSASENKIKIPRDICNIVYEVFVFRQVLRLPARSPDYGTVRPAPFN